VNFMHFDEDYSWIDDDEDDWEDDDDEDEF
jgi:hypothetical protein